MKSKDFWFFSLCALVLIANATVWSVPMRVAVALNSIIVMGSVISNIKSLLREREGK